MSTVSRGFRGRRRPSVELPPGQYLVEDFPVLSAGPTPGIDLGDCANCGREGPMAEARVFDHAPGVVARCPACDQVLLRLVHGPGRAWMDLRGLAWLQLPVAEGT